MQSTSQEVRQAIKQLPIQQRAVAIALKKIFDQVKELTKKEQQQIDANHLTFISKFKQLQQKVFFCNIRASAIIQGKNKLIFNDLDTSAQFFTQEEQAQKSQLMANALPISQYWYRAFANSEHGDNLTQQQQVVLKAFADLQTNITTNQISLTIVLKQNPYLKEGTFTRSLVLDNGMPVRFTGDEPQWISKQTRMDGVILGLLLTNSQDQDKLASVFGLVGNVVNEIVPYSLQYYLGAVGDDQEQEDGENEQQEEDEQEDSGSDK